MLCLYLHPIVNSGTNDLFEPIFLGGCGSAGRGGHDEQKGARAYRDIDLQTISASNMDHSYKS